MKRIMGDMKKAVTGVLTHYGAALQAALVRSGEENAMGEEEGEIQGEKKGRGKKKKMTR